MGVQSIGIPTTVLSVCAFSGGAGGDASLQNMLDLSVSTLKSIPPYGHREVLLLSAGLSSCDPGNIFASIKICKDTKMRYFQWRKPKTFGEGKSPPLPLFKVKIC